MAKIAPTVDLKPSISWLKVCVALMFFFVAMSVSAQDRSAISGARTASVYASSEDQVFSSGLAPLNVVEMHQPCIVKLFGAGVGNLDSYGSGVLVSSEGHVITVWNHLINTGFLTAVTNDGQRFSVSVTGTSRDFDLAVLKLNSTDGQSFPHVDLNTAADVDAGQSVLAFSNMFRVATGNEPVSVVHGTVAAKVNLEAVQGRWTFPVKSPVLIVDAITNNSGATGGLLTTVDGRPAGLLGREIRHLRSHTWVNYAVPLTTLKSVVDSLIAGRRVDSAAEEAGKKAMVSDRELTRRFGLIMLPAVVDRTPAYVDSVNPGSVAQAAGFRRGDLIVLLDDDIITSVNSFREELATRRIGQPITVTISRDQQLQTIELRVP